MGLLSVSFITILVIIFVLLIVSNILAYRESSKINSKVVTRGINGLQGQTINLSCPAGQTISFSNPNATLARVALVCGSAYASQCDSFTGDQTKSFYNANSINLITTPTSLNISSLQGKNSGSFTVPDASDPRVNTPTTSTCLKGLQSCSNIQVVGTYDCVSN